MIVVSFFFFFWKGLIVVSDSDRINIFIHLTSLLVCDQFQSKNKFKQGKIVCIYNDSPSYFYIAVSLLLFFKGNV